MVLTTWLFLGEHKSKSSQNRDSRWESQSRLQFTESDWNEAIVRHQNELNRYNLNNNLDTSLGPHVLHISDPSYVSSLTPRVSEEPKSDNDTSKTSSDNLESSSTSCYLSKLDISCILGLLSLALLIFCLIAPQWCVTTHERSSFLRLNPWDLCLNNMILSHDHATRSNVTLHGCYNVWDPELRQSLTQDFWNVLNRKDCQKTQWLMTLTWQQPLSFLA